eukprot:Awhi_evm1s2404
MSKQTGNCKWFDTKKGFGFITPSNGAGADIFVHQSSIQASGFRSLAEGESVEYDLEVDDRSGKEKAVNVTGPGGADVMGAQRQQQNNYGNGGFQGGNGGFGGQQQQGGYGQQ